MIDIFHLVYYISIVSTKNYFYFSTKKDFFFFLKDRRSKKIEEANIGSLN